MKDADSKILKLTVKTRGMGKLRLELEGKILSLYKCKKGSDWTLQIPVEQISVIQKRHSKLKQMVTPLAVLLACALVCFFAAFIVGFYHQEISEMLNMVGFCFLIILIFAVPVVCIFAVFATTQYAYISAAPINYRIEFWVPKKMARQVNDFLAAIQSRQSDCNEQEIDIPNIYPIEFSKSEYKVFPKFITFLYISCLPALFLEKAKLLYLCLLPIAWYAFEKINYLSQPKEYRQAVRNYLKGNIDAALEKLQSLTTTIKDFMPALLLIVKIHIERKDFDNALKLTNIIQDIDINMAREIEMYIINCKRIDQRRTELLTEQK